MKMIVYITNIIAIMVLYHWQSKLRKPTFNRIHNVWNEDKESLIIADGLLILIIVIAFTLGLFM